MKTKSKKRKSKGGKSVSAKILSLKNLLIKNKSFCAKKEKLINSESHLFKDILTCRILNSDGNDLVLQDGICHSI